MMFPANLLEVGEGFHSSKGADGVFFWALNVFCFDLFFGWLLVVSY